MWQMAIVGMHLAVDILDWVWWMVWKVSDFIKDKHFIDFHIMYLKAKQQCYCKIYQTSLLALHCILLLYCVIFVWKGYLIIAKSSMLSDK